MNKETNIKPVRNNNSGCSKIEKLLCGATELVLLASLLDYMKNMMAWKSSTFPHFVYKVFRQTYTYLGR
jgi:hypothetical protein